MSDRLARLLHPLEVSAFLTHLRKGSYLFGAGADSARREQIMAIGDLDVLFQSEQLPASFFDVVNDGIPVPVERWSRVVTTARGNERVVIPESLMSFYGQGATLIVNRAQESVPVVNVLCRELTEELGFLVGANVYITPPGAQGFPRHADPHEVLVVQISGSKCWVLYPEPGSAAEILLKAGDLLFIPRGLAHEAKCRQTSSVHVTLGLNPVYEFQLVEELAALAREHAGFQRPVFAGVEGQCGAEFFARLQEFITAHSVAGLLSRRRLDLIRTQRQGWAHRLSDMMLMPELSPDSFIEMRSGIMTEVTSHGTSLRVNFAGSYVDVPVFLRSCLEQVLGEKPFFVRDLGGLMTEAQKVEFVRPFVSTGLLAIVSLRSTTSRLQPDA